MSFLNSKFLIYNSAGFVFGFMIIKQKYTNRKDRKKCKELMSYDWEEIYISIKCNTYLDDKLTTLTDILNCIFNQPMSWSLKKILKNKIKLIRKRMKELYSHYGTTYMYEPVKLCWSLNIKNIMKFHRTQHKRSVTQSLDYYLKTKSSTTSVRTAR